MPNITINVSDCNNIHEGKLILEKNKLNIKYGMNGTGKSTIAQGLELLRATSVAYGSIGRTPGGG